MKKKRIKTWLRTRAFHVFIALIDSDPAYKYRPGDCEPCHGLGYIDCAACEGTGWKRSEPGPQHVATSHPDST